MNVNKGNSTLNYLFGTFILLSAIKISTDLYERYTQKKTKTINYNCGKK